MRGQVLRSQPLLFGARFFSDRDVELLLGKFNHVRVPGTAHLLKIQSLFKPLDLFEGLRQGEFLVVGLELTPTNATH